MVKTARLFLFARQEKTTWHKMPHIRRLTREGKIRTVSVARWFLSPEIGRCEYSSAGGMIADGIMTGIGLAVSAVAERGTKVSYPLAVLPCVCILCRPPGLGVKWGITSVVTPFIHTYNHALNSWSE